MKFFALNVLTIKCEKLEVFFYNINMTIGERIKELRIEKNLSQLALAQIVGVSQKAVDFWERNVNEPKASYIINLVKTFEISFDEFFNDVE